MPQVDNDKPSGRGTGIPAVLEGMYADVVASDPEIKERVRALVHKMIDEAEYLMEWGGPSIKTTLVRASLPAMMRSLRGASESDEVAQLKAAYLDLLAEIRNPRARVKVIEEDEEFDVPDAVHDYIAKLQGVTQVAKGMGKGGMGPGPTINNGH